jgi:hypothetical protein
MVINFSVGQHPIRLKRHSYAKGNAGGSCWNFGFNLYAEIMMVIAFCHCVYENMDEIFNQNL